MSTKPKMSLTARFRSGTTGSAKSTAGWKLHIRFAALLHMAIANLRFKKLRSSLTILGIAIGTGSVFLLMSFGLGLQSLVASQVSSGQSINTIDVTTSGSRILKIEDNSIKDVAAIRNVQRASGYYAKAGKLTVGGATADVVMYGVDSLFIETSNLVMRAGTTIDPTKTDQIAISASILEAVGVTDFKQALGTTVTVKVKFADNETVDKKFTVVGVVSSGNGSEAFISPKVFTDAGVKTFAGAKALVSDREYVQDTRRSIESLGYGTTSPVDTLEQVDQFFRILRVVLVSFGAIGMIIAILGMINTLTVSLLERVREVALMNALGARPRDMKNLFIIEAIVLSLVGGVVGIIGALWLGAIIDIVLNQLAIGRGATAGFTVFSSPIWLIALVLLFMAGVGYLVAFAPARRAAKVNSVEVLRRE